MDDTATVSRPVPIELLKLRSATTAYLSVLRDVIPLLEQWADVSRLREPVCSQLLDEIRAALHVREMGTPAGISRVVAEMLGER